jgi:pSer/pThr/pTyr-binding forkhead associated (FHA) protein
VLKPGDTLGVGGAQLRFEASQPSEEVDLTMINSEADLDLTIDHEVLPVSVHETGAPRLVIFTGENTWEVPLETVDSLTIGRTDESQVVIAHPKVSRRHAELSRKGELFILRDLDSTNGTWHKGERVEERILQDGDVFRIGGAQVIYKSGFTGEALTMVEGLSDRKTGRRPVVFVPGIMGSELWLGSERVWPNLKTLFRSPEIYSYPGERPLEPRGIVDQVVIVPNLIKLDQYNRLGDYLVEDLGYERGKDFFEFAYDWRQDVRLSARKLAEAVDALALSQPVTIIAHSLGTLVTRYYIERLGGKSRVERAILMGGPHQGAVKIVPTLLSGPDLLPFGLLGERLRQVVSTFPSNYQILPTFACALEQNGRKINFLEDDTWVSDAQRPLLHAARQFRQELGRQTSVPAISIFGYGIKTVASVTLNRAPDGRCSNVVLKTEPRGDSTILESSAALDNTEIHPVQQYHGSLFVDNDVKMRLKLELSRPK